MHALKPDFLFSGGHVHAGASLVVRDGLVESVGDAPQGAEVVPMPGRALLPGLVAAHSHAFQRAIRGRTKHRNHPRDDFWSWREAMYAAADLRMVLLRVAYGRSGFRVPENPRQKRFIEGSADEYLKNLEALSRQVAVGAAPHSVRACPADWIREIAGEAFRRGWPLHLHVSEQRLEVEQCRAEHGTTPALLL